MQRCGTAWGAVRRTQEFTPLVTATASEGEAEREGIRSAGRIRVSHWLSVRVERGPPVVSTLIPLLFCPFLPPASCWAPHWKANQTPEGKAAHGSRLNRAAPRARDQADCGDGTGGAIRFPGDLPSLHLAIP